MNAQSQQFPPSPPPGSQTPQIRVFRPQGELVAEAVHEFRNKLHDYLVPNVRLIVDFSLISLINSAAVGYIVVIYRKVLEQDGKMALCGMDPEISEIFRLTNLDRIIPIYDDLEQAKADIENT